MKLHQQGAAFGFRFLALVARFVLTIEMARVLGPDEFGFFMLFIVVIQIAPAVASMDVYAETIRVILQKNSDPDSALAKHFSFLGGATLVVAPVAALSLWTYNSSASAFVYLALPFLVIAETYAIDFGRFLAPLGKPVWASVYLFLRQVLPVALIVLLSEGFHLRLSLADIVAILLAFSVLSAFASLFWLGRGRVGKFFSSFDGQWVRRTIRGSALFFAGTLLFRAIFGLDRFFVESATSLALAGVYALYVSIGFGIMSVLEAGVSSWKFPSLVRAMVDGDTGKGIALLRSFVVTNLASTVTLVALAYLILPPLVTTALGPEYQPALADLPLVLGAVVLISGSLPFHYMIFGKRHDGYFLTIYLVAALAMVVYSRLVLVDGSYREAFGLFLLVASVVAAGRVVGAMLIIQAFKRRGAATP